MHDACNLIILLALVLPFLHWTRTQKLTCNWADLEPYKHPVKLIHIVAPKYNHRYLWPNQVARILFKEDRMVSLTSNVIWIWQPIDQSDPVPYRLPNSADCIRIVHSQDKSTHIRQSELWTRQDGVYIVAEPMENATKVQKDDTVGDDGWDDEEALDDDEEDDDDEEQKTGEGKEDEGEEEQLTEKEEEFGEEQDERDADRTGKESALPKTSTAPHEDQSQTGAELGDVYRVLEVYTVSRMKPAQIGYAFKMSSYHATELDCQTNSAGTIEYMARTIDRASRAQNARQSKVDQANAVPGLVKFQIMTSSCHPTRLAQDEPSQIMVYYNIDRTRVNPKGESQKKEARWTEILKYGRVKSSQIRIPLDYRVQPTFRIRLTNFTFQSGTSLQIRLWAKPNVQETQVWWTKGVNNADRENDPRFMDLVYEKSVFASVTLSSDLYRSWGMDSESLTDWLLVEPVHGRIRLSTGIVLPMNIRSKWDDVTNLVELDLVAQANPGQGEAPIIATKSIRFEKPTEPEQVKQIQNLIHHNRPVVGANAIVGQDCIVGISSQRTSTYFIKLDRPVLCVQPSHEFTGHHKTPRVAYAIRLFKDELIRPEAGPVGGILMIQLDIKYRYEYQPVGTLNVTYCNPNEFESQMPLFRLALFDQESIYLTRRPAKWSRFDSQRQEMYEIPVRIGTRATNNMCDPMHIILEIVYILSDRQIRVTTDDTSFPLLIMVLDAHPQWLGLEIFTHHDKEYKCEGCFAQIQIDRRAIQINEQVETKLDPLNEINQWEWIAKSFHDHHLPKNYVNKQIVKVEQVVDLADHRTPTAQDLQYQLIQVVRKLAELNRTQVIVLSAKTYCNQGHQQIYQNPAMCLACPPGTQSMDLTPHQIFPTYSCINCPKGTYQDLLGQSNCKTCDWSKHKYPRYSERQQFCPSDLDASDAATTNTTTATDQSKTPLFSPDSQYETQAQVDQTEAPDIWSNPIKDLQTSPKKDGRAATAAPSPMEISTVSTAKLIFSLVGSIVTLSGILALVAVSAGFMLMNLTTKVYTRTQTETE